MNAGSLIRTDPEEKEKKKLEGFWKMNAAMQKWERGGLSFLKPPRIFPSQGL